MLEFYHNLNINTGLPPAAPNADTNLKDNNSMLDGNERADIVGTIKSEKTQEICEGCGQKIKDRYFMKLSPDQFWHEQCLLCCICRIQLSQTCYTKNTKVYCKDDYYRIFGVSSVHQQNQQHHQQHGQQHGQQQQHQRDCYGCGERIAPSEMVMRAKHLVYHLHCFLCYTCNRPLQKGEPFSIRAGKLICQHDLEKDFYGSAAATAAAAAAAAAAAMHHHHGGAGAGLGPHLPPAAHLYGDGDDYLLDDGLRTRDGRRGPKRPRTILTSAQRRQFKASFDVSPKPCRKVREALAKDTGLSVRVVQVWFQNQRAKMKKISRKSKANANGATDGEKNHSDKEDKSIKLESPSSDHSHYLGLDSSYSSSSQPLNPNLPYSPDFPDNSDASLCSSDISLDESFDNVDEATSDTMSLQNLDLQPNLHSNVVMGGGGGGQGPTCSGPGLHGGGPQQLVNHNNNTIGSMMASNMAGSITHIDKLYLMQNSYFNSAQIEQ
ncbi:LIM homeobox transcription factor 1-beta [Anopheles arabiensis]|uniref:LIM homeobox transcription factor 1-beta n=1 Tax=Anopheles arabiensis TaxID=7173 RepID=UPI001AAD0EE2|nr:LIM homeobox transcription factor 1-beta [Anopheles arabiensis]